MNVAMFSAKPYDVRFFEQVNEQQGAPHAFTFFEPHLTAKTAILAKDSPAVCVFVNDRLDAETLQLLADGGTRLIALRCAGFNNVDLPASAALGLYVVRVPAYSPHAIAEHTAALILSLNRKISRAHDRVREGNFALDGLLGFDLNGRTVGVIGTGKIGRVLAKIMVGFGCEVLACDPYPHPELEEAGGRYVALAELLAQSDIVSLHCPLTPETYHLIDDQTLPQMKRGVMIINTSRGAVIDTPAVIEALKSGQVGYLGLDVYEEEGDLFFEDLSNRVIQDDVFARLLTFPNVLITGHQAFFTEEALTNIAETTLANITAFEQGAALVNEVTPEKITS